MKSATIAVLFWIGAATALLAIATATAARYLYEHSTGWRKRRRAAAIAEEERVIEGLAIMAGQVPEAQDWITERLNRVMATHKGEGVSTGSPHYIGRHSLAETSQTFAQVVTGVFDTQEHHGLSELIASHRCTWCEGGEHGSCPGCSCPCSLVEVA